MEDITEEPLMSYSDSDDTKKRQCSKGKKYLLLCVCVTIGILAGVLIGYFAFGKSNKSLENNDVLINNNDSDNSIHSMKASTEINVNFDIKVDINKLISQIAPGLSTTAVNDRTFQDGSRFVSIMDGGYVIAAYNHPKKYHSATAVGGIGAPTAKSQKGPKKWAIAKVKAGIAGRRTYYDSW